MTRAVEYLIAAPAAAQAVPGAAYPVPTRLNLALVACVIAAAVGLLTWASRVESWWALLGIGVLYSYLLLTNYALLHEATHDNLQPTSRNNYLLGVVTGTLFPIPFTLIHSTHQNHHARNRTDSEMFDLYYPHDNRLRKWVQWYGILFGFFWPIVPVAALLFSLSPRPLRRMIVRTVQVTDGYVMGEIEERHVWAIRLETLLIVAFFAAGFVLLGWTWPAVLVCYACFSFNWSTRQYIGHAFAKRHVIEGAWNLRHLKWMSWLLLHGEYDLNHHRRPDVPWCYLPRLSRPDEPRLSYIRQYWRQWGGPRLNVEKAPEPMSETLSFRERAG
jgi:fatty acid desaturase